MESISCSLTNNILPINSCTATKLKKNCEVTHTFYKLVYVSEKYKIKSLLLRSIS